MWLAAGHAGDEEMMRATIEQALRQGVAVGAASGLRRSRKFGRVAMELSMHEIRDSVYRQVLALGKVAEECGAEVAHVKPHGALYNRAAQSGEIARAIAEGVGELAAGCGAGGVGRVVDAGGFSLGGFSRGI